MADINYGPLNQVQNNTNTYVSGLYLNNTAGNIVTVRVLDIILDKSHPRFKEYGEWNGIGTIFYELVDNPISTLGVNVNNTTLYALPLFSNIKQYPLINELTYIILLPSNNTTNDVGSFTAYYFPPLNTWNSPHHNATPVTSTISPAQSQDYIETELGSYRRVEDTSTEIYLGDTFKEKIDLHPLLPYEGDIIYEGRWGNSIRLGSTVKNTTTPNKWSTTGENGDPILILRNGQTLYNTDSWVPEVEDINSDKSSIYLTSTQQLPLFPASVNNSSFSKSTPPTNAGQYEGNQIILNSGRLALNAKSDSILALANKSIQLSCNETLGVDAKQISLTADKIYLGSADGVEGTKIQSVVLGENLNTVLNEISVFLTTLSIAFKTATYTTDTPLGPTQVPITSLQAIASDAETLSNDILNIVNSKNLLSKTVKTI